MQGFNLQFTKFKLKFISISPFQLLFSLLSFFIFQNFIIQMNAEQQSIGMMQGAFFVPKGELINWVNVTLGLNITKIEQLGTGAVYCNLVDAMYPGKVAMQRVNWRAHNEWECLVNLKILQQAFARCGIQKHIQVEKLSKCRYQDNLEFIQWMKRYLDLYNKNDLALYDAVAARRNAQVDFIGADMKRRESKAEREDREKEKAPLEGQKPKIVNRSLTLGKSKKNNDYYTERLAKIRDILRSGKKETDKLVRIQQLIEQIQQQLPGSAQNYSLQKPVGQSKSKLQLPKIEKIKKK